jgi:hypothetical protein
LIYCWQRGTIGNKRNQKICSSQQKKQKLVILDLTAVVGLFRGGVKIDGKLFGF